MCFIDPQENTKGFVDSIENRSKIVAKEARQHKLSQLTLMKNVEDKKNDF